jgi:hypothetical protein
MAAVVSSALVPVAVLRRTASKMTLDNRPDGVFRMLGAGMRRLATGPGRGRNGVRLRGGGTCMGCGSG